MPTISTLVVDVKTDTSKYTSGMKSAATSTKKVETAGQKLGSSLKSLAGTIGVAFGAAAIVDFGKKSIEAFDTLEKNTKRLEGGLERIGQGKATAGVVAWSKKFSLQTGINQADIVDMTSKLTQMGGAFLKAMGPQAASFVEHLTGGLQDMAAATGKSASMLMRSLGPQILNTPLKAIGSLTKYGVANKKLQGEIAALGATDKAHLNTLVKSGAVTRGYASYVRTLTANQKNQNATQLEANALETKFRGTAAATATPMEKLSNLFNQAEIAAGRFLVPLVSGLVSLVGWLGKNISLVKTIAIVVGIAAAPFLAVAVAMRIAAAAQLLFNVVMEANPIGLVIAAVALLAIVIIRNWTKIKAVTQAVWGHIKGVVLPVWHAIMDVAQIAWKVLSTIAKALFTIYATEFKAIWAVAKFVWSGIVQAFKIEIDIIKTVFKAVKDGLIAGWKAIRDVGKGIWSVISGAAIGVFNAIANAWNSTVGRLSFHVPGWVPGIGGNGFDVPDIPTFATGGIMPWTGLALVHKGETVTPAGGGFGNVTVNVYGSVMTERDLATSIQKALLKDKRRSGALGLA